MTRDYQHGFSSRMTSMYDTDQRVRKARTLHAVLADHCGDRLARMNVLTVGASTGIIDAWLSQYVHDIVAIDIDEQAIAHASANFASDKLHYRVGDAMALPADDNSVDIVVCSQVYEHVPDAGRMMAEIRRVLRPGGVCYFAANNRLIVREPHYGLYFLSWLPPRLADLYMRLAGKGTHYYERHLTLPALRRLTAGFRVHDYTHRIVADPERFQAGYMIPARGWKALLVRQLARRAYWLFPGYIWLLEKPAARGETERT
ncbi:MAG: class I SAM-dependent methyltransferase [Pseudomonadota bacterium]